MINRSTSISADNSSKNVVSEEDITLNILDVSFIKIFFLECYVFEIRGTSYLDHIRKSVGLFNTVDKN